jgi:hypothetical protein
MRNQSDLKQILKIIPNHEESGTLLANQSLKVIRKIGCITQTID